MVIPASEDVLKKDTGEIEHFRSEEESNDVAAIDLNDPEVQLAEKKLRRKIDLRMSILVLVYILNYLDRNNISAARLKGVQADLHINDTQYSTVLSILYVGYILMQVPSNMMLQLIGRPSIYLPTCMVIWGLISLLTGITHNFTGALLCRFFLGFIEAAFFPGAVYLISQWYRKNELGVRTCILYCGALISNAFGPLVAAGILGKMEGKLGIRAWRWLFYIEGAITMAVAIAAMFVLPDFPHNTRGLKPEERALAVARMADDNKVAGAAEEMTPRQALFSVLGDLKVWNMALTLTALTVSLTFNQFFPTLTATLGYSKTISLLLCAPPFFLATICAWANARHSDHTQERYWHIVGPVLLGMIGFIIAMTTKKIAPRYVSLFLMAASYASFVIFLTWISTSFPRPALRRSIAIAFIVAFSQLGNVAGAYVFPSHWGPSYAKSYAICIGCGVATIIGCTVHRFALKRLNKQLDSVDSSHGNRYCL